MNRDERPAKSKKPATNVAGDFLVMAATLMEIKSAMLLPRPEVSEDGQSSAAAELADPRFELVQKLLEYKRFKDAASALEQRQREQQARFPRFPAKLDGQNDEPPPVDDADMKLAVVPASNEKASARIPE